MEKLTILVGLVGVVVTLISTGVPFLISIKKAIKKRIEAVEESERVTALRDMTAQAQIFIENAEVAFKSFDKMLKAQGSSAGAMKKENVITKLQAYALSKGYDFDVDFWNEEVDEIVNFTKEVNGKK